MNALGFQVKHTNNRLESKHSKKAKAAMIAITADGSAKRVLVRDVEG